VPFALVTALLLAIAAPAAADDVVLSVAPGPGPGEVSLTWTGSGSYFDVYRSLDPANETAPATLIEGGGATQWVDTPPVTSIVYYIVTPPACGNGVRDPGEQCDDGNGTDLDGCGASCGFEQVQRATSLKMQFGSDATCTTNALGGAFVYSGIQTLQQSRIDTAVANGNCSLLLAAIGAHDLTGASDPSFQVGFLSGAPQPANSVPYDGTSDLDWWYSIDPGWITPSRQPLLELPASITSSSLAAGPGAAQLPPLFNADGPMRLASARVSIAVGQSTAPALSPDGGPPGHLAAESLDPALVSYATCGTAGAPGTLCGDMTAASLAAAPLTSDIVAACTAYTTNNTMLDLIVSGCKVQGGIVTAVKATQPDHVDTDAPVAGAGGPYRLLTNGQKVVTACEDKNGQVVDLPTCLTAAAYSSYFEFTTDRVIPR
jgi:cysteine-rich repeat protein